MCGVFLLSNFHHQFLYSLSFGLISESVTFLYSSQRDSGKNVLALAGQQIVT